MTAEFLLETLENHFKATEGKLSSEEESKFIDLLRRMAAADHENAIEEAKSHLYDFCLKNPFLKEILLKAEASLATPVVFRGKPNPKSMTKESKRVRLKANRLIDAIEKADHSQSEKKNERSN